MTDTGCDWGTTIVDRGLFRDDGVNRLSVSGEVEEMDRGGGVGRNTGRTGAGVDGCPDIGTRVEMECDVTGESCDRMSEI